ncbi:MAG: linear amide C-N hydrolase [Bacteroidales bacterium]|nr:linear amide C-N hydrolase [Bacteroidales bacterium]
MLNELRHYWSEETVQAAAPLIEDLDLLRRIDMHSDTGAAHHYAISDASGRSVVVEYVDKQMEVVESPAMLTTSP